MDEFEACVSLELLEQCERATFGLQ